MPHEIKTGNLEIKFPRLRRITVSLIGDDTHKPIPEISVHSVGDNFQTGFASFGTTDTAGKTILWLPPGKYRGIRADPRIESRYIRTEEGPLVVEPGPGEQYFDVVLKSGCELQIEAINAATNQPVPGAFFWKIPVDEPSRRDSIDVSTFVSGEPWTDAAGMFRAVLKPEPTKLYRFQFAGIRQSNMPWAIQHPDAANKQGYSSDPSKSEPVEIEAGKTIRLRFALRKIE